MGDIVFGVQEVSGYQGRVMKACRCTAYGIRVGGRMRELLLGKSTMQLPRFGHWSSGHR